MTGSKGMLEKKNYNLIFGTVITVFISLIFTVGYLWTPYDPNGMGVEQKLAAPSLTHLLGCDNFGRDILSRIMVGGGTTVKIAAAVVLFGLICGVLVGAFTGYYGGWLDELLMRVNDVIASFPSILLALVFISFLGTGTLNLVLSLGLLFIPGFARITRSQFAHCITQDYVNSAKLMGVSDFRIMFVHILPNVLRVLTSTIAIGFNNAVLAEVSLSFLGVGVMPPDSSLGRMLSESQTYFFSAPWYTLSTGMTVILLILGFGLLSDGLVEQED